MKSNRYKILVVEDEPNINEFVCTLLEVGGVAGCVGTVRGKRHAAFQFT